MRFVLDATGALLLLVGMTALRVNREYRTRWWVRAILITAAAALASGVILQLMGGR